MYDMRTKHRQTLERVFDRPTPADIRWADVEAMLRAADIAVSEGSGSRVRLIKGNSAMVIPRPETGRATVRDLAKFLSSIGVEP